MKQILIILLFTFAAFGSLYGQELNWRLSEWDTENVETLGENIQNIVDKGYAPVGLSFQSGRFSVLFIDNQFLPARSFALQKYKGLEEYEKGLEEALNNNLLPVGGAQDGNAYYGLFLPVKNNTEGWKLVESNAAIPQLETTLAPYVQQGVIPYSLFSTHNTQADNTGSANSDRDSESDKNGSDDGNRESENGDSAGETARVLVLKNNIQAITGWKLEEYPADGDVLKSAVLESAKEGYIPWGLDRKSSKVRISYILLK